MMFEQMFRELSPLPYLTGGVPETGSSIPAGRIKRPGNEL